MSFMHFDATSAAAAVGQTVGFTWESSPPFSTIVLDDGGDGFWGESIFELHGEGEAIEGEYRGYEHGFLVLGPLEWINPASVGSIDQYCFRCIDIKTYSDGTIPGTRFSYSGVWTDARTDWRSLAIASPHTNMTADPLAQWAAEAAGAYGSSYYEETVDCILQIGRVNGIVETFEFTNVDIGADEIVLVSHGFETGDQVIYQNTSGTPPTPLVDQTMYSVRKISNDRISLGNSLGDIDLTDNFINLTFTGTGTGHAFQRIDSEAEVRLILDSST